MSTEKVGGVLRRLSDAETLRLICLVRGKPCLWNEAHPDFKNAPLRRKLWRAVASHLTITGDEAKGKWKNLKDKFRKLWHVQEEKFASGTAPSAPRWRFYNALLFTKDSSTISENGSSGSFVKTEAESDPCLSGDSNENSSSPSISDADLDLEVGPPPPEKSPVTALTVMCTPTRDRDVVPFGGRGTNKKKKKIDSNHHPESGKIEAKRGNDPPKVHQGDHACKKDDDYHFLMSLLPYMEVLDPLEKLDLRFGLQRLVTDSYRKHVSKK